MPMSIPHFLRFSLSLCLGFLFLSTAVSGQVSSALIIGDKVRMRSEPNLSSSVLGAVNFWEVATVLEKTEEHYTLEGGKMTSGYGWSWYHLEFLGGKKGWVYGQFVAEDPKPAEFNSEYMKNLYKVGADESYELWSATSRWYDEPVDDGPYFDEDRNIYYIRSQGKVFPILKDGKPFMIDNWGTGKVEALFGGGRDLILLEFRIDYMDGTERVAFPMKREGDKFLIEGKYSTGVY